MKSFNLETFDTRTGTTLTSYPAEQGDDADDACAILRAELASYPEYLRLGETWGVREVDEDFRPLADGPIDSDESYATALRVCPSLVTPEFYSVRTKRAVNSGGAL